MGKIILVGLAIVGLFTLGPVILPMLLVIGFAFLVVGICQEIMYEYYRDKYRRK